MGLENQRLTPPPVVFYVYQYWNSEERIRQFKEINVVGTMPVIPWEKLTFTDFEQILLHGIKGDKPESFWEREILADHPNKET